MPQFEAQPLTSFKRSAAERQSLSALYRGIAALDRSGNISILLFTERLQRLAANVPLRTET